MFSLHWRWHVTMLTSILHRVTGAGLYGAGLIVAAWAVALASGPEAYGAFMALLGSPLGKLVVFAISIAVFYHLANGVRHLIWDAGHGLDLRSANSSAYAVFGFTIAATLAVWVIAFMAGVV
jgi:succinate dehydrogenase / fumarate reductase, cytochrome b subunit